jgi:hypothetical protein
MGFSRFADKKVADTKNKTKISYLCFTLQVRKWVSQDLQIKKLQIRKILRKNG